MNLMTIDEAIYYIISNNSNLPNNIEIIGFDLSKLIPALPDKSSYNYNYYMYNNFLLLEECIEDENTVIYYLVVNNKLFMLGNTECHYNPEVISLYTY